MSKSQKPTIKPVLRSAQAKPSEEEQRLQVARYLANEKKTYFQVILAGLVQNPAFVDRKDGIRGDGKYFTEISVRAAIDAAIEGADYAIEKLYPVEKKED